MLLHGHELFVFLADLVGQALAFARGNRAGVITIGATQADHAQGKIIPFVLQGLQAVQAVDLLRVVADQGLERGQLGAQARPGHFIGVEKMFITGDEIAAHAGFHVDGKLHCFVGVTDHPVGVFHPLDHRQQVTDDHGKHDGAQQANPQRQGHVAAQKFAETALIDRRRLVHRQRPEQWVDGWSVP
ncbi:hypothetical protein D9M71_318860 [compost metagenome]